MKFSGFLLENQLRLFQQSRTLSSLFIKSKTIKKHFPPFQGFAFLDQHTFCNKNLKPFKCFNMEMLLIPSNPNSILPLHHS
jgi:hypothetical protein